MGNQLNIPLVAGATPLSEDDREGLNPQHIVSLEQLNEWEQMNILVGERWALTNKRTKIVSEAYVRVLHRRMFNLTWDWAGRYRHSNTSVGDPHYLIPAGVRQVIDDVSYWLSERTFSIDEIAVRFHHRLVKVHPFPNGNGRHARLIADIFLRRRGLPPLTWGSGQSLQTPGEARAAYIAALKLADNLEYDQLLAFARS